MNVEPSFEISWKDSRIRLPSKPIEESEESVRGGLLQPTLERKDLEQPLLELKSELQTLLDKKKVDTQQAKII